MGGLYGNFSSFVNTIKKLGWKKSIFFLILYLIPIFVIGFFQYSDTKRFNSLQQTVNSISSSITNSNNLIVQTDQKNPNNSEPKINVTADKNILGLSGVFNPADWIIDNNFELDPEKYYCLKIQKFTYWSMWSKQKYPPNFNVKIRLKVKTKNETTFVPTIHLSYGEYVDQYSPITFYSINIFDNDLKSIRLYDGDNISKKQSYLPSSPNLKDEMQIILNPRIPDPNKRTIILNPTLTYNPINSEASFLFEPKETFSILAPTVNIDDGTIQKQIGIGTRNGICIKLLSVEFSFKN